ncbi:MAG: hypothetical protein N2999_01260 [Proteobacteria bacterium]|nr:hypothetical protein [Pseudomonadota bacterium]
MARKGIIFILIFSAFLIFNRDGFAYNIYLKNGKVFDAVEHRQERGLFIIKLRLGYEVGIPLNDIDFEKTNRAISDYEERKKKEQEFLEKKRQLEEKEKPKKDISELEDFVFEKRGMQLQFPEDEISKLINLGEKYADRVDDILKPYTFFYDYLPSVVYTKRLRLILYGTEKVLKKRNLVTTDIHNILQDPYLLIFLAVTSDTVDFLKGAKVYIEQNGRIIEPFNFKVPDVGERTNLWPNSPAYYFKILANFAYKDIDISKEARLIIKKDDFFRDFKLDFPSYR